MATKKKKKPAAKKTAKKTAAKKAPAKKKATTAKKKPAKKAAKKPAAKQASTKKKATKKVAKKAAKKVAKKAAPKKAAPKKAAPKKTAPTTPKTTPKTSPATVEQHDVVALPAKKKLALSNAYVAPTSAQAALTLVPDGEDGEDALEEGISAAFDDAFDAGAAAADAGADRATQTVKLDAAQLRAFAQGAGAVSDSAPTQKIDRAALLAFVPGDASEDLAQACAALCLDKKADDVVILKVADLTSYADYFVIAAAPSERQVMAIARNVTDELKQRGKIAMSTDGLDQGNWVIVDYGSVVLHVFLQSARRYYDLDGFWVDAPRVAVDELRGQGKLATM